jgi:hypothetical protein
LIEQDISDFCSKEIAMSASFEGDLSIVAGSVEVIVLEFCAFSLTNMLRLSDDSRMRT